MSDRGLRDVAAAAAVQRHEVPFRGHIFDIVRDVVDFGDPEPALREYLDHPGGIAVVALDAAERVALINQYRHPVRSRLWELPAGLLDVAGEVAQVGAARELAEEADLCAGRWEVLVDFLTSPGCTNEHLRVFLAREITPVPPAQRFHREAEEASIRLRWVPLDEAVAAVLAGDLHNPSTVVGVLATFAARAANWATLRPIDSPMPYRRN